MAKHRQRQKGHETGKEITTKSWFGSHADMVVEELEDGKVVCKDDKGTYTTYKARLDSGVADPNRYSGRE
tara:strand:- start:4917 stop:5126 length:210 start_codon:yes stop_codon:yes gene_type:complete